MAYGSKGIFGGCYCSQCLREMKGSIRVLFEKIMLKNTAKMNNAPKEKNKKTQQEEDRGK